MNKQLIKYFIIFILSIIINFCFLKKILNLSILNLSIISIVICLITLIIDCLLNNKVIDFFQQKQDPKDQKEVMNTLEEYENSYKHPTHQPTQQPTHTPTQEPTPSPTQQPSEPTGDPTRKPTILSDPTLKPIAS